MMALRTIRQIDCGRTEPADTSGTRRPASGTWPVKYEVSDVGLRKRDTCRLYQRIYTHHASNTSLSASLRSDVTSLTALALSMKEESHTQTHKQTNSPPAATR